MQRGGESQTQRDLEAKEKRQEAIQKQQNRRLQEERLRTLRGRAAGFAGTSPTSLFTPTTNDKNQTLG